MDTFNDFKNSFNYGKRNNLNFKFMSLMTDDEAANFIEELLSLSGELLNEGNIENVIEHIFQGQKFAYSSPSKYVYQEGPFNPFIPKLSDAKIGLLTSSGHFVAGDDPAPFGISDMTQQEAINRISEFVKEKPTLSFIPKDTPVNKLCVRHAGYDISGAQIDPGVVLPIQELSTLEQQGIIGELAQTVYSFVGACSQGKLKKEIEKKWMDQIKEQCMDGIILIPV
ncbi:MAG: glycine/sarcosine/betaine reductase selenoprotein B family protein [Gudongella sp.]|nr:glycine/sarcosine/betaine reductase selenoprotein B family protein [Gudongella sp.]